MNSKERILCMLYYRLGAYREMLKPEMEDEDWNEIMSKMEELGALITIIEDDKRKWEVIK